jgi:hypothetical protein
MVVHACNPSYLGNRGRKITVQGQGKVSTKTPTEKHTKSKRTGDMAQMVEYLPSKHEALSSSPVQKQSSGTVTVSQPGMC